MSAPTRATYRTMTEGTAQDYALIERAEAANNAGLVDRVLALVEALAEGQQAYPISRLDHCLQSATRAFEDNRPADYVVAALLHDIGDTYAPPHAHGGAFASAVIAPYVSEQVAWIVRVHPPEFQQYYYAPHMGGVRDARERYRGHPPGSATRWSSVKATTRTVSTPSSSIGRLSSSGPWSKTSSPASRGSPHADSARASGGGVVGAAGARCAVGGAIDVELPASRADERNHQVSFVSRSDVGCRRRWRILTPLRHARNVVALLLPQGALVAAHAGDPALVVSALLPVHRQHLGVWQHQKRPIGDRLDDEAATVSGLMTAPALVTAEPATRISSSGESDMPRSSGGCPHPSGIDSSRQSRCRRTESPATRRTRQRRAWSRCTGAAPSWVSRPAADAVTTKCPLPPRDPFRHDCLGRPDVGTEVDVD